MAENGSGIWVLIPILIKAKKSGFHTKSKHHHKECDKRVHIAIYTIVFFGKYGGVQWRKEKIEEACQYAAQSVNGRLARQFF